MKSRTKKRRYRKWVIRSLFILFFLSLVTVGYSYFRLNQTMDQMYKPVERIDTGVSNDQNQESRTFLLLGIDRDSKKQNDVGRTDVIMIAIVNDKTKKVTLTSIPRDTYVEIAGKGYKDKINAAYQYGIATTIATVENFTNIHFDNYILVNYDGVVRAIDAVGGIRLNLDESFVKYVHRYLPEYDYPGVGEHLLNGHQALYFARFRHDTQGDFGRNNRQQQVIKAFLDQSIEVRSPLKIEKLLGVIGNGVQTDITKNEMISLVGQFKDYTSNNIESIHYKAIPARFGPQDLWYVLITDQERERVSGLLKERLNADENTVLTDPTVGMDQREPTPAEIKELIREQTGWENPKSGKR